MRKAILSGSFDPITNGHLDLVERGLHLFDELIIVVSSNDKKQTLFSLEERITLARQVVQPFKQVKVVGHTKGLLVDVARHYGAVALLRGVRQPSDLLYEQTMAMYNKREYPQLETVVLFPKESHLILSSSGIKELFRIGGDISNMVPPVVASALAHKIARETLEIIDEY